MADQLDRQIKRYIRKLGRISRTEVPRANASALNKVGGLVKTRVVRGISKETRVPQKEIRKRTFLTRANPRRQRAFFKVYPKPVPAVKLLSKGQIANKLGTGTSRRGVRAKGYQWGGAFIQRGINDNPHVFRRKGSARLPLERIDVNIGGPAEGLAMTVSKRLMKSDYRRLLQRDLQFRLRKYHVR